MKFLILVITLSLILGNSYITCSNSEIQAENERSERNNNSKNELQNFRLNKMKKLQENHTWFSGINEKMNDKYVGEKDSHKKDKFVSYLDFVRDSSYKTNKNILLKQIERFSK